MYLQSYMVSLLYVIQPVFFIFTKNPAKVKSLHPTENSMLLWKLSHEKAFIHCDFILVFNLRLKSPLVKIM